jgi:hypothetical protein
VSITQAVLPGSTGTVIGLAATLAAAAEGARLLLMHA